MKPVTRVFGFLALGLIAPFVARAASWADEPIDIGTRPQLFVDDYLIDNRYPLKGGHHAEYQVLRKFHAPVKYEKNPVLVDPELLCIYHAVRYDADAKLFRMWYGGSYAHVRRDRPETLPGHYHVRYAESKDGLNWVKPNLGVYPDPYFGKKESNVVLAHPLFEKMEIREREGGLSALGNHWVASPGPIFLDEWEVPKEDLRGYKYLMTYAQSGKGSRPEDKNQVFVIGSKDGIHWDRANQKSLGMIGISDGWLSMVYDPVRKKYVAFTRPRDRYHHFSPRSQSHVDFDQRDFVYSGIVRRIGRMESDALWTTWNYTPRTIFLPDELDLKKHASAHMSIAMKCYHGIYFAYLKPFHHQVKIWSELAVSRDGKEFERLHETMLDTGPEGTWDAGQAWASGGWVEVGDEWWIYYFASSRGPNLVLRPNETFDIGVMKLRKEGFLSMNMPEVGGLVVTKMLEWPGGDLIVNADVRAGEMRVRVSDVKRAGVKGFDFSEAEPFSGNSVKQRVSWKNRSLDELKGKEVRLEFYFSGAADLYGFRATGSAAAGRTGGAAAP